MIRIRIQDYSDRRTREQRWEQQRREQEIADQRLELEWRRRVGENVQRRITRKVEALAAALEPRATVIPFPMRPSR